MDALKQASSSVGSNIFAILSLLAISLLVLLLLRHYLPLRTTPAYLLVPVFLALALPCSIILLVPVDLASATEPDTVPSRGVWLPERVVLVTWRITYWLTFVLTWFILPFLGEYCDSGHRDTRGRLMHSLRTNLRYQIIGLVAGVVGLVYFILQNGFHAASIKGLVMALAYAFGLVLAIGLMGHGLVALPRSLFKNASVSGRLRRLQTQAPKTKDSLDEATDELAELENTVQQLKQRKSGTSRDFQEWIDELADTTSISNVRPGAAAAIRATNPNIPAMVTERYLADLTRKFKRARHKQARFEADWSTLCQQALSAQIILDASSTKTLVFPNPAPSLLPAMLTPSMRYHVHKTVVPSLRLLAAALFALASTILLISELIKPIFPSISIVGLTVYHPTSSTSTRIGFAGQLLAALWLCYMDACALYAISDVKVWGNRALVKRHTYAESACWYSLQVAKLTVPLSYNFITMLPPSVYKGTAFYNFLGKLINLTPLGSGFSAFFPCFLLLPVLASGFNVYGRLKRVIGFGVLEDDSEDNPSGFGTGGWREGKVLIEQANQSVVAGGGVGLATRDGSLDVPRAARGREPLLPSTASDLPARSMRPQQQFNDVTNREEDVDDDGPRPFYQDFAERVRNTFEGVERPEWLKTKPRWMQSEGEGGNGNVISRLFGGGSSGNGDGRVRL